MSKQVKGWAIVWDQEGVPDLVPYEYVDDGTTPVIRHAGRTFLLSPGGNFFESLEDAGNEYFSRLDDSLEGTRSKWRQVSDQIKHIKSLITDVDKKLEGLRGTEGR